MSVRTVIVDDEPLARERLRQLLAREPDVELVGECRDGAEAVAVLRELKPDLVFLDVQMPELDGFEVLAELGPAALPRVVFVTAYDQYAIRAFEVHALDYLLKPFDQARFSRALGRAREDLRSRGDPVDARLLALLEQLEAQRQHLGRFVVRADDRIFFVRARDVECVEATGNYMVLHVGADSYPIRETMTNLERRLDPAHFVRVHRSFIINLERTRELEAWFHGGYVAVLASGRRVHVSRKFRDRVDALLRQG
ncbi:MAG TPA: response regulator [Thermoanaerobaculaceae bacterium]|nr:response regulator [Thermoanaerobaculaceae bacterium]